MTIDDLMNDIPLDLATSAHAGTSFSPDVRGRQEREAYAATLARDFQVLETLADTDEKRAMLASEWARYRQGYRRRKIVELAAKARCMSTMIAGPSNFPSSRNRKRSNAADRRAEDLAEYRCRTLALMRQKLAPLTIRTEDADALERLRAELDKAERLQAQMRAVNAAIRRHAKAGADAQTAALVELGLPESAARELIQPDYCGRIGFADYQLSNNNARIRRLNERMAAVATAQASPTTETVRADGARVEDAPADNRVRLYFGGKPDAATRAELKAHGFRWAPSMGCWQAYRNHRALAFATQKVTQL